MVSFWDGCSGPVWFTSGERSQASSVTSLSPHQFTAYLVLCVAVISIYDCSQCEYVCVCVVGGPQGDDVHCISANGVVVVSG